MPRPDSRPHVLRPPSARHTAASRCELYPGCTVHVQIPALLTPSWEDLGSPQRTPASQFSLRTGLSGSPCVLSIFWMAYRTHPRSRRTHILFAKHIYWCTANISYSYLKTNTRQVFHGRSATPLSKNTAIKCDPCDQLQSRIQDHSLSQGG